MSFLNLIMTDDFISIISDGQITTDGVITKSHFKKFEISKNSFVVGITGFELITNQIRKKFYYQPEMTFDEAKLLLIEELEHYKTKQLRFGQSITFNAIIAGFSNNPLTDLSVAQATTFHIENQTISEKNYEKSAILSLTPDDITFNPNRIISENISRFPKDSLLLHLQTLQRNALYKVAEQSKTVNKIVFQETIFPKNKKD